MDATYSRGKYIRGAVNLAALVMTIGIIAVLAAVALAYFGRVSEAGRQVKLRQEVVMLNGAVKTFLNAGGNLSGLTSVESVLLRLKTSVPLESAAGHLALNGAMIDRRIEAVMQSAADAGGSEDRVLWDPAAQSFQIRKTGAGGASSFRINPDLALLEDTANRTRVLDGSRADKWVWGYADTVPGISAPVDVAVTIAANEAPYVPPPDPEPLPPGLASASGYFLSADLGVLGIPLTTGDVGLISDSGYSPFSKSNSFSANIPLSAVGLSVLSAKGGGTGSAASDVGAGPGARYATGMGQLTSFSLDLLRLEVLGVPVSPSILKLEAEVVRSTSTVSGLSGHLTSTGTSTVTDLKVRINGASAVTIPVSGEENQGVALNLLGLAGVELTLNKTNDGPDDSAATTASRSAIYLKVTALSLGILGMGGLVDGEIHIGRSFAQMEGNW